MLEPNGFDLFAARADRLNTGAGHFPGVCQRRGLSSVSRPINAPLVAGECGRATSSRRARTTHLSGDRSAAASVTRFLGLRLVPNPNSAGGFGSRHFSGVV